MKELLTFLRNKHEEIYKIFLFLLAVTVIVFLLPKDARFKYEFQKGKPWLHSDLIAPFDFPIYKSDEVIEAEKIALKKRVQLFFNKDVSVKSKALFQFEKSFNTEWNLRKRDTNSIFGSVKKYDLNLKFGKQVLTKIYDKGILFRNEVLEGKPKNTLIHIIENKFESQIELSSVLTVDVVASYVDKQLIKAPKGTENKILRKTINEVIYHNVFYDKEISEKQYDQMLASLSLTKGKVQKNTSIVKKGDLIDRHNEAILLSFKREYEHRIGSSEFWAVHIGQFLMVSLAFFLLIQFIHHFRADLFESSGKIAFLLFLILLTVLLTVEALKFNLSIYIVPFCILPIVLRVFFDTRLALYVHIITLLIVAYFAPNSFEFLFLQIIAGAVAIFSVSSLKKRSQFVITSLIIFSIYSLSYFSIGLVQEGAISRIDIAMFIWFAINATLTLLIYPLIYLFEKAFNFVSDITLLELSDTNSELLKMLATKAPGTFQHALQVANLAEAAVEKIGGNTLLVRTGALYHDIGKVKNPYYFIENQSSEVNPHDDIAFEESANIIIHHVIDGVEMAKKHNIPDVIIDFIRTHHGTSLVQYFYQSFLKSYPDQIVDETQFMYPGPLPYSKETAVLMMADSVEAASRSIKQKTAENIESLVGKIIDSQLEYGQFNNANITLRDIKEIKKIFKKMLMNIYHIRIEY